MSRSRPLFEKIKKNRLIALLAPSQIEDCCTAYEVLDPEGVVLEVALRTEAALAGIAELHERYPEGLVLAGTVLTARQAELAIDAGAAGVVSPDTIPEVIETCVRHDIMCIPGGLGDVGKQLVQKAALYGCDLEELRRLRPYQWIHKLFPAFAGGLSQIELARAWRGVYRDLVVVYTGGVTIERLGRLHSIDPAAVACGSALARELAEPKRLRDEARAWRAALGQGVSSPEGRRPPARTVESGGLSGDAPPSNARPVVTFGELMLRLSPPAGQRIVQARLLDATYGGAEANVAASLARFGTPARLVTALPAGALGDAALEQLRAAGVETTHVIRREGRLGIYFLEHGASQRPSRVIYDRAQSTLACLSPGELDWERILDGACWFHWTGITPALSEGLACLVREALGAARRLDVTVSADINYRSKLWSRRRARDILTPLLELTDIAIGNEADLQDVFGLRAGRSDPESGTIDTAGYAECALEMIRRFGLRSMAITLRASRSASDNDFSACAHDGRQFLVSRTYPIHVVDRVGAGDAFAAGLIYSLRERRPLAEALEFAVAAGCLKHTVGGDFNVAGVAEVEALARGETSGRVKR